MSFRSYTIPLVIFRDQVPFERTPNNFDINLGREGQVGGQQKVDQLVLLTPKTQIIMVLKNHNKR